MTKQFKNREEAGKQLALSLTQYANRDDVIVLGLPRGGVPVAFEIAKKLHLPLDVFIVRKLGVPFQEELAMGAIASENCITLNQEVIDDLNIASDVIQAVAKEALLELHRREKLYRGDRTFPSLKNKTVILGGYPKIR